MKRILLIASIFPPEIGGPATFIDKLAHELVARGHIVTVVCNAARPGRDPSDATRPFRIVRVYSTLWAIQVYKMIPLLAWFMLWNDKVLVNGFEYSAYWASRITGRQYILKIVGDLAWEEARVSGTTALDVGDFQAFTDVSSRIKRLREWRQKYLSGAKKIVVPSEHLRRLVLGWHVPDNKIKVIYNGILLSANSADMPRHRTQKQLKVVFVGRLINLKGVETLLLAVNQVEDIEVHIFGDGPEYSMFVILAEQLGIASRVRFWRDVAHEILREKLREMDVLVLGSSTEGLSHTLLEAGDCGLACIASNRDGNIEIIEHNKNGLLYPYGNVDALVKSLKLLRDNESIRYRLACEAKDSVRRFDFSDTVTKTMEILLEK